MTFSDAFNSNFMGSMEPTNSSGIAMTLVNMNTGKNGFDPVTASASATGYNVGIGSNSLNVLSYGNTQLAITESLSSTSAKGGTSITVSGQGGYVTCCGLYFNPVSGATVTITDTLGSKFNTTTTLTNNNGYYAFDVTLPKVTSNETDIITVTVSDVGYTGSASSNYIIVTP